MQIRLSKREKKEQKKQKRHEHARQKLHAASPLFHQFSRLPDELRLRIWELSMEPRDVANESVRNRVFSVDPQVPKLFHVCYESREHLKQFYKRIKYYDNGKLQRSFNMVGLERPYFLLNVDLDYLRINHSSVQHFSQIPDISSRLRHLTVECTWFNTVINNGRKVLSKYKALETLTLLQCDTTSRWTGGLSNDWRLLFMDFMRQAYYTCDPAPYHIKCLCPSPPEEQEPNEVNASNYLLIDRKFRLEWLKANPRNLAIPEVYQNEVNGDVGSGGYIWQWGHTESCGCKVPSRFARPEWANASLAILPGFSFSELPGFPFVLSADDRRRIQELQ